MSSRESSWLLLLTLLVVALYKTVRSERAVALDLTLMGPNLPLAMKISSLVQLWMFQQLFRLWGISFALVRILILKFVYLQGSRSTRMLHRCFLL